VADALGMVEVPALSATGPRGASMTFLELKAGREQLGRSRAVQEDAFLVALQLRRCHDFDLYASGRRIKPEQFDAGATAIFDLRTDLACDTRAPFHAIDLLLPRDALEDIADELGGPRIASLEHTPGVAVLDPVARHLLLSIRPALANPRTASAVFVDHVANALAVHIALAYGGVRSPRRLHGGLARWQERRATEMLEADLAGRLSLADLAQACGLSIRHFTRAFRQSTGLSPHRWLVGQRVERAKALLQGSSSTLSEIALACGFADQSHFSRLFSRATGTSPGVWRRARRLGP
jgi:AraC-like DNA-binding protein